MMRYFWTYLLCIVSLSGCIVTTTHAQVATMTCNTVPVTTFHIENGYHDDDGREHEPVRTRREQLPDHLRRDNRPDEIEEQTDLL
ncbi:hypothetical protein [Acinetobacter sp.]|uniref:hypothetical protein n=1 Tax=Acinetobacter sp. TaxID=472 RepID=UPI0031E0BD4C